MPAKRNKDQNIKFWRLMNMLPMSKDEMFELKEHLILQYTEGRTSSSKEIYSHEMARLLRDLEFRTKNMSNEKEEKKDKMRKKILAMAHEMGWETPAGKIDWKRLNNWLYQRSYLQKGLNAYTYKELPKLVSQFEQVYKSHIKGMRKQSQ